MPQDAITNRRTIRRTNLAKKLHHKVVIAAQYLDQEVETSVTLKHLASVVDLPPSALRRAFINCFGVTPRAYHASVRRQTFRNALQDGANVTDATYAAGYGSSSRVVGHSGANLGMTPSQFRRGGKDENIRWAIDHCQHGLVLLAATKRGVCCVQFGDRQDQLLDALEKEFPNAQLRQAADGKNVTAWMHALRQHLDHHTPCPSLPLDMRGTAFQVRVWQYLLSSPAGETRSYSAVATDIGKPTAHRAVARACATNRVAALIPCHRVLHADGKLGGYRWGTDRKSKLLANEAK